MSFLTPKQPRAADPAQPVNPADTENRIDDSRRRRMQSGGRNSTWLGSAAGGALAAPRATLTGVG